MQLGRVKTTLENLQQIHQLEEGSGGRGHFLKGPRTACFSGQSSFKQLTALEDSAEEESSAVHSGPPPCVPGYKKVCLFKNKQCLWSGPNATRMLGAAW